MNVKPELKDRLDATRSDLKAAQRGYDNVSVAGGNVVGNAAGRTVQGLGNRGSIASNPNGQVGGNKYDAKIQAAKDKAMDVKLDESLLSPEPSDDGPDFETPSFL